MQRLKSITFFLKQPASNTEMIDLPPANLPQGSVRMAIEDPPKQMKLRGECNGRWSVLLIQIIRAINTRPASQVELRKPNGEKKCALSQKDGDSDFGNYQQLENPLDPLPSTTPSFAEKCTLYRLP